MSEESEDKQKQAKKLSVLSKLFGTPGDLFDLINPKRSQRRRRSVAPMRIARPRIKENEEFKIVGRQVPDIEAQVRTEVLQNISDVEPKMIEPVLKRLPASLQDLRRTIAPARKGMFVTVKTKLGRTKKTRIT
tara:strand:+ start:555 stop:953 length:399 start_codon:yes stop_codon:yes gene_type:complete